MPLIERTFASRATAILVLVLAVCAALPANGLTDTATEAPAEAPTSAVIAPSLTPDRLGAHATLTFTIRYAGGAFGVPSPVRHSVLRLPAGLSLDIPHLRSCSADRLRAHGPRACPARSRLGSGHALMKVHAGSQPITEDARLWAFIGPPRNLSPTFEILAHGYTPIDQRIVLTGTVRAAAAPYGEELALSIPPIPTLRFEPDASVILFSLTIGSTKGHHAHTGSSVILPAHCPGGGFPFGAEFTYADGSTGDALATVPCPR